MKKILLQILNTLLMIILLSGCGNFSEKSSSNLKATKLENIDTNLNEWIMVEPTIPQWSLEQSTGADMADIDYASNDFVIFHGSFGLFVYDLNNSNIIRSLDLKSIKCDATQGDAYCNVEVSNDGNTVHLHAGNSKKMYIYSVNDNTLCEANYSPMENSFKNKLVEIGTAIGNRSGRLSCFAVQFNSGEYGYLTSNDLTLGTLDYVRGDKRYSLFRTDSDDKKTEEDYRKKLGGLIDGCRLGLNDTKEDQKMHYDQSTQDFIDKMEIKLAYIESQMKVNDELAKNSPEIKDSTSNNISYKILLDKFYDRSDVD